MSTEEELLVGVFPLDDAEVDEAGQEGNDLGAREVGATHDLIEGEALILQHFEYLLHSVGIGHHRALRTLRGSPEGQMDWRGYDVLICYADIGLLDTFIANGIDGTTV